MTRIVLVIVAGIAALVLVLVIALQTPWVRAYLRDLAERQAEQALGAEVSIGSLGGNLLTGAELSNVRVAHDGQPIATIPHAEVRYSIFDLLTGDVDVASVALREPVIHLRRTDDGALNLAALGAGGQPASGDPEVAASAPSATRDVDGESGAASDTPGRGWAIGDIVIEGGTLTIGDRVVQSDAVRLPERLVDLDAALGIRSRPAGGVLLDIDAVQFRAVSPDLQVQRVEGEVVIASDTLRFDELSLATSAGTIEVDGAIREQQDVPVYDLDIASTNLQLPALAPLVPALEGYQLSPSIEASLDGSLDELRTRFEVEMGPGGVSGQLTLDVNEPQRAVSGTIQTRSLDLAALQLGERTDLSLTAEVDLQIPDAGLSGVSGTYKVTAPEFQYGQYQARSLEASGRIDDGRISVDAEGRIYGGTVQTEGSVTLPSGEEPLRYDLQGRLRDVDPSRLPGSIRPPGVSGRGGAPRPGDSGGTRAGGPAAAAQQGGSGGQGIDLDFGITGRGDEVEGEATLRDVSIAGADFSEQTTVQISRKNGRLHYSAEGAVTNLDLRRLGRELGMEGLTGERYASDINARFDITGAGTELENLTLQGTATLIDSDLLGATVPRLVVTPDLTRGSGTIALNGRFEQLDVGALSGNPALESRLQGTIDVSATLENLADPDFSLGEIEASGQLTLADSSLSGVPIESAVIDATLSESMARVRELTITGPGLAVEAAGTLALDRTGTSDLRYLIDTPALQRFEALGVPAEGNVLLKGHLSGNLARLRTEGTLSGTQVAYGDTSALSISSTYEVVVPELSLAEANVSAVTELTELEAAGRSFASVRAETDYIDGRLDFDAAVEDHRRNITAGGRLVWHPDHQELHLRTFGLRTPEATWTLTGEEGAAIQYAGDSIAIGQLVLVSTTGGRIAVDGTLGSPDSALTASIQGLRLDSIDDLILEEEPLAGSVDATATIMGTVGDPTVDAEVIITNGGYRGFSYERAEATIGYTSSLIRLDAEVQQREGAVITAEGIVPLSETSGEKLRLEVRSAPVDLALVQTFTDELQDVRGTAELDVTVLGSLSEPLLDGSLHVRSGAFTVVLAQSRYTGLDTDITFDRDLVRIREFVLLDDEGNRLRIGGQLPLTDRRSASVDVRIESDDFEIADNRLAELNVDTAVRVTGTLLRPRIEGRVALGEGFLRVDRILQLTQGAYQVEPASQAAEEEPGVFEPTIDVTLAIPDSLVLRGTDLQAPGGGPVGLGNVNITIGGELQIRKQPGEDMTLLGELQTIRGEYEFQGRQFSIQRDGRIRFLGRPEINPRLDIRAQREISGVIASVHVTGVLDAPELALSSQPPLEDAEILSLIVFNQPLSLLGTGAQVSLATRATALASAFVASQLTESLGEILELDLLEIETATADGALTPVLTLGEQIGRLYVKLRQQFGPEAVSQAIIEYRLAEWVRLQSSYSQGDAGARNLLQRVEAGGLDLLFFFSY